MRKVVDFKVLNSDASEMEYFGRVILEDGVISYDGLSKKLIEEMNTFGIIGKPSEGPIFPTEGEKFLNALPREFSGSMLRASAVHEVR